MSAVSGSGLLPERAASERAPYCPRRRNTAPPEPHRLASDCAGALCAFGPPGGTVRASVGGVAAAHVLDGGAERVAHRTGTLQPLLSSFALRYRPLPSLQRPYPCYSPLPLPSLQPLVLATTPCPRYSPLSSLPAQEVVLPQLATYAAFFLINLAANVVLVSSPHLPRAPTSSPDLPRAPTSSHEIA